jgi:hypothetical protein
VSPAAELSEELQARIGSFVSALVRQDEERYESEFVHLQTRVQDLVERKLGMEGTKSDTRDFLGELLFTRMRRGMHALVEERAPAVDATRAAEWVMGMLFSVSTLTEFAKAFDHALIQSSSVGSDFNFAGRTDFISVEEVMQMLAAGKHLGCLSLEKGDNRLDVYLADGRVFFLDPHTLTRRVLPGADGVNFREISQAVITEAEARRGRDGVPCILTLVEKGVFGVDEQREVLRMFGKEALFDFMRESDAYAFYYRKLDTLPEFAVENDLRLGVTSILLEGSKLLDDWQQMLTMFPDPDAPLEPKADMYARMERAVLGALDIKLLSQLDGETSPRALVTMLGLPLADVYMMLIRLSREGILASSGDFDALQGLDFSRAETMRETMQEAFAALDANDDDEQRQSAIDRVFGDEESSAPAAPQHNPRPAALSELDKILSEGDDDELPTNALDRLLLDSLRKKSS